MNYVIVNIDGHGLDQGIADKRLSEAPTLPVDELRSIWSTMDFDQFKKYLDEKLYGFKPTLKPVSDKVGIGDKDAEIKKTIINEYQVEDLRSSNTFQKGDDND